MYDPVSSLFQGAGSLIGYDATRKAANQQADAAQRAQEQALQMYNTMRSDLSPWRTEGTNALNTLSGKVAAGPGEYTKSPYYDFLMQEGTNALNRGASAKGNLLSGAQNKALTKYGQNLASTDYQQWLNNWYQSLTPYQSLATMGQNAATMTGQAGLSTGQNVGNYLLQQGQAQAAGTMGQANTLNNLLNTYGEGWQTNVAPMAPNNALSMFMGSGGMQQAGSYLPMLAMF